MTVRDLNKEVSVVTSVAPAAALTATTTGASADLAGYRSAMAIIVAGVATDGTIVPSLEESDDNSSWSAVAAGDLSGTFASVTAAADETVQEVGYLGTKRYIRVLLTETVASAGQFITALIVRGDPLTKPQ